MAKALWECSQGKILGSQCPLNQVQFLTFVEQEGGGDMGPPPKVAVVALPAPLSLVAENV